MGPTMVKTFIRRTFSSLRGPARTLGALHFVDSLGNGLFMAGSAVYFVTVAGLPATVVGLGLSLAGLSGFVASLVFGRLTDRTGARRLLAVLLLLLAGAYALYPAVHSPAVYFPVVVLTGALEYGCGPAFGALIAELVPEGERVTARAALRSLFNAGFSAGAGGGRADLPGRGRTRPAAAGQRPDVPGGVRPGAEAARDRRAARRRAAAGPSACCATCPSSVSSAPPACSPCTAPCCSPAYRCGS